MHLVGCNLELYLRCMDMWTWDLYIAVRRYFAPFHGSHGSQHFLSQHAHRVRTKLLQEFGVKLSKLFFIPVRSIISCKRHFLSVPQIQTKQKRIKRNERNQTMTAPVLDGHVTYVSSGVSWTGSSVNWGSKLSRSSSDSRGGRKGGRICFWLSCKKETHRQRIGAEWRMSERKHNMRKEIKLLPLPVQTRHAHTVQSAHDICESLDKCIRAVES